MWIWKRSTCLTGFWTSKHCIITLAQNLPLKVPAAFPIQDVTCPHLHSLSHCSPKQCVLYTIPQSADNFHCFSHLVACQNRVSDTCHNRAQTMSTLPLPLILLLAATECFSLATTGHRQCLPYITLSKLCIYAYIPWIKSISIYLVTCIMYTITPQRSNVTTVGDTWGDTLDCIH